MSGLVTMTPDYCECWNGKATINDNGGVDFENIDELKLDGVFTPDFDNYVVYMNMEQSASGAQMTARLIDSSGPSVTGYTWQSLNAATWTESAGNTTPQGERKSDTLWRVGAMTNVMPSGVTIYFYGPSLPQPTAMRSVLGSGHETSMLEDHAGTHSSTQPCSGFTIKRQDGGATITGNIIVMGYAE